MKKRIITIVLTIALCITTLGIDTPQMKAAETSTVGLQVDSAQPIEIALGVGNTKVNYSNFENDLKAELINQGVDSNRISFTSVEGSATAAKNEFTWWKYDHTNGSTSYNQTAHIYLENNSSIYNGDKKNPCDSQARHIVEQNNGKTMKFYGYGVSGYKDFNFMPNEQATKKTIQFTIYEQEAHDAFDGVGFLINSSITGSKYGPSGDQKISGYLLFLQYNGATGQSIKLFKLENVNTYVLHQSGAGSNFSSDTPMTGITRLATAATAYKSTDKYRKLKIEVMPDYVKVWYNGNTSDNSGVVLNDTHLVNWGSATTTLTSYPLVPQYDNVNGKDIIRGGYGPLVSYQGHGCEKPTYATLDNLSMEAEYVRELTSVIREPNWDSEKTSFLVNLNEDPIEDFSNKYTTGEIINRLADDSITYLGWCGENNASQSKVFVDGIGNGSALININDSTKYGPKPYSSDSYKNQIKAIAGAIVNKLNLAAPVGVHTYLTSEKFSFSSTGATLNDGNWSVGYSKDSFEHAKESISTYQNLANASFSQSGYYEVYYNNDTAKPKAKIRIHEAPVALFNAQIKDGKIVVYNHSYDPEFCDNIAGATGLPTDGIKINKVEYRNLAATNPSWTETEPETVSSSDAWMVRLTVEDADGETSMMMQQVAQKSDVAPYGTFRLSSTQYTRGIDSNVAITDASYTLDGSSDFEVKYSIKDSSGTVKWTSSSTAGNTNYFAPNTTYQYALSNLGVGTYTISMTAKKGNATSAAVSKTFKVAQGYKITYDANTGSGAPETQYKVQGQELQLSSIAPTKAGFTFGGWKDASTGTTYQPGVKYTANQALQLKAIWYENMTYSASGYRGVYDGNPHALQVDVSNPVEGATIRYGTSAGSYTESSLSYTNAGTYTVHFQISKEGYQTVTSSRTIVIDKADAQITLDDKTVNYSGLPISGGANHITGISDTNQSDGVVTYKYYMDEACTEPTTSANSGAVGDEAAPAKPGLYYVKAYLAEGTNYKAAVSNVAKLTLVSYSISYNMNGHGTQMEPTKDIVYGTRVLAPKRPVDTEYYFNGWFKDSECTEPWDFLTENVLENVTIFAKWTPKSVYDVKWQIDDEIYYGTLEEALQVAEATKPDAVNIELRKDYVIEDEFTVPSNVELTVPDDVRLTITEDGQLNIPTGGKFVNNGKVDNKGTIKNEGTLVNKDGGKLVSTGNIENEGNIDNQQGGDLQATDLTNKAGAILGGDGEIKLTGNFVNDGTLDVEATWTDKSGVIHFDDLQDALNNKDKKKVTLCKDVEIDTDIKVPTAVELVVPDDKNLSVGPEGELDNQGIITANSKIPNDNTLGSEAVWQDEEGKYHYGPIETAVKDAKDGTEIDVIKNADIKENITIPEGVTLNIPEDITVKVNPENQITNKGVVANEGTIDNQGKVINKGDIVNTSGNLSGNGDYNNRDGKIQGGTIDEDTTITAGKLSGNVTNNGTLAGVSIEEGANIEGTGQSKEKQEAPRAANIGISNPTQEGMKTYVYGVTKEMEYSLDNGATWIQGTGKSLTGFEDGTVIRIRYRKTDTHAASESFLVKISNKVVPVEEEEEDSRIVNQIVNIGEGTVNLQVQVGSQTEAVKLDTPALSVINNVLTADEKEKIKQGLTAKITIQVEQNNSDSDKKRLEKFANQSMPNGVVIGDYYDITVWKTVNEGEAKKIENLNSELEIRLTIPEKMRNTDKNVKRTYYVSRIHGQDIEKLPTIQEEDNTLLVKSSKFSIFAIMYKDSAKNSKSADFVMDGKTFTINGDSIDLAQYIEGAEKAEEIVYHACSHTIVSVSDKGVVQGLKKGTSFVNVIIRNGKTYKAYRVTIKVKKASKVASSAVTFKVRGITYEKMSSGKCRVGNNTKYAKKTVNIPNSVKYKGKTYKVISIAPYAFMYNKKIKTVNIGQNVKSITGTSFVGCNNLTVFKVNEKNKYFKTAESKGMYRGMLLSKNGRILYTAPAMRGKVTIPSTVEAIGEYAICSTAMKELVIPKSVKTIYPCALAHNKKMQKVAFKGNVPEMPLNCIFDKMSSTAKVFVPQKQLTKYQSAFSSAVEHKQFSSINRIVGK